MAWPNINQRKSAVYRLCNKHGILTPSMKKKLAKKYNCSYGTIHADIVSYLKPDNACTYPSKTLKRKILARDGHTCQYCDGNDNLVVDHVISTMMAGPGLECNLVTACWSCNMKKRSFVWVPKNIEVLRALNKEWADKIVDKSKETLTLKPLKIISYDSSREN